MSGSADRNDALVHRVRPPRAPSSGPAPILVLLHGRGADEGDLLPLAEALDPRFVAVSVRAPFPLGPGWAWYGIPRVGEPDPAMFRASLERLDRFLDQVVAGYPIDPTRLFVLGFSQGAVMSGALLLSRPRRLRGAVLLSGYLPLRSDLAIEEAGLRGAAVFAGHGTADSVIPVGFGREARDYLTRVGADLSYREYPIGHQIAAEELDEIAAWLRPRLAPTGGASDNEGRTRSQPMGD